MVIVEKMTKTFRSKQEHVVAVQETSLRVETGEMVTLLGPSGCGKTTTLRCVAGLETPDGGKIQIGDRVVVDREAGVFLPAHQRQIGMVFQSYAIWPHMTVFENVAYALEGRGLSRAEIARRTNEVLDIVHLTHLANRPAPRLSGGQQQRVAIARALVGSPELLLFDEPLSNLDAKLREEMRTELRKLQKRVGVTAIYVTHDQDEALAISDQIIVMNGGQIVERGRPIDIYRYPKHVFTAQFIGTTNLVPGKVRHVDSRTGYAVLDTSLGSFTGRDTSSKLHEGHRAWLSIRPEDLRLSVPAGRTDWNQVAGRVDFITFMGAVVNVELAAGDHRMKCQFRRDVEVSPDSELTLHFAPDACVILPDEPGASGGQSDREEQESADRTVA